MERELEVKLLGLDIIELEKSIVKQGGILIAEERQVNTLIEPSEYPLIEKGSYLRIRETADLLTDSKSTVLTYKKKLRNEQVRENIEITCAIDDVDKMLEILKHIGLGRATSGSKYRKSYEFISTRIDIDTWDSKTYPYPYAEVEVENMNDLQLVLDALEIDSSHVSTKSIKELQDELNA